MFKHNSSFWFTWKGLAALELIGIVAYFLLMEYGEYSISALPLLILLPCLLMHIIIHGGLGANKGHGQHNQDVHDRASAGHNDQHGLGDADPKHPH